MSFYITVKNGLLDPKHIKAMGGDRDMGTIWLFLWLLDKMTIIDHEKGEGKVLGGKPVRFDEVQKDLMISRRTYARWIEMLRNGGYIETVRTPYGLCITVYKAFKVFGQRVERSATEGTSPKKRSAVKGTSDMRLEAHLPPVGGTSNKTEQLDKTEDNNTFGRFWDEYPRKTAKKMAERAWMKIKMTNELYAKIMAALEEQKRSQQWTKDDGRFIPHPATWINQERWEDQMNIRPTAAATNRFSKYDS